MLSNSSDSLYLNIIMSGNGYERLVPHYDDWRRISNTEPGAAGIFDRIEINRVRGVFVSSHYHDLKLAELSLRHRYAGPNR